MIICKRHCSTDEALGPITRFCSPATHRLWQWLSTQAESAIYLPHKSMSATLSLLKQHFLSCPVGFWYVTRIGMELSCLHRKRIVSPMASCFSPLQQITHIHLSCISFPSAADNTLDPPLLLSSGIHSLFQSWFKKKKKEWISSSVFKCVEPR